MTAAKKKEDEPIPVGVCTAPGCRCSCFQSRANSPMYCWQTICGHSVEWHHVPARELRVEGDEQ